MKYVEQFYTEFAKYVQFKQEWWYVQDQLLKWTEKQFLKQEFKSRKEGIINRLLEHYDSKEVRYLIEVIKQNEQQDEDALSNSEIIDDNYCIDKKEKKRRRKKKLKFPFLSKYKKTKKKPHLIDGYLPIEKYLATERLKSDKVTYKSVERLDI